MDLPPMKRGRGRPRGNKSMSGSPCGGSAGGTPGGRSRVTSANSLHAARSKIKNGGRAKTSCHQCKNNKDPSELLFCKNVKWGPGKKKGNMVLKHCRKKFCAQCMGKYETIERVDELFRLQEDGQLTEWQCPACADTCECAACWRKRHPNTAANIPKPPNSSPSTSVTATNQTQTPQQPPTPITATATVDGSSSTSISDTTNSNTLNTLPPIPPFAAAPPNVNGFDMSSMPKI